MSDSGEILKEQLRAICVYEYIKKYITIESEVKKYFNNQVLDFPELIRNELYFIYGVNQHPYYNYAGSHVAIQCYEFKADEKFGQLTLQNIVNFSKSHPDILNILNDEIPSLRNRLTQLPIKNVFDKLVKMRNILAHSIGDANFNNCVVDQLPVDFLNKQKFDFLKDYDLNDLDEVSVQLLSNYVYLSVIEDKIKQRD